MSEAGFTHFFLKASTSFTFPGQLKRCPPSCIFPFSSSLPAFLCSCLTSITLSSAPLFGGLASVQQHTYPSHLCHFLVQQPLPFPSFVPNMAPCHWCANSTLSIPFVACGVYFLWQYQEGTL